MSDDFDNVFNSECEDDLIDMFELLNSMILRKEMEVKFYKKLWEIYNNLSDGEKLEYQLDLSLSSSRMIKKPRKNIDDKMLKQYIRLRCGFDYDNYNVGFWDMKENMDNIKCKRDFLDTLSKHLYGKFYQDYIMFEWGCNVMGSKDVEKINRDSYYKQKRT